jgi:hypothetical protein
MSSHQLLLILLLCHEKPAQFGFPRKIVCESIWHNPRLTGFLFRIGRKINLPKDYEYGKMTPTVECVYVTILLAINYYSPPV